MRTNMIFMALLLSFAMILSSCSNSANLDRKEDTGAQTQTVEDNTDITPNTDISSDIDTSSMDNLDKDISAVAEY